MPKNTFDFLQGQLFALTYALDLCLKHTPMPVQQSISAELQAKLDGLCSSMLEDGLQDGADGVECVRLALMSGGSTLAP